MIILYLFKAFFKIKPQMCLGIVLLYGMERVWVTMLKRHLQICRKSKYVLCYCFITLCNGFNLNVVDEWILFCLTFGKKISCILELYSHVFLYKIYFLMYNIITSCVVFRKLKSFILSFRELAMCRLLLWLRYSLNPAKYWKHRTWIRSSGTIRHW